MALKLVNFGSTTIASGIGVSDTTIALATGTGVRFPTMTGGDYFYAVLQDVNGNQEVVKCTARSTDSVTVTRAQESSTALTFAAGSLFELRLTLQNLQDYINTIGTVSLTGAQTLTNKTLASPIITGTLDLTSVTTTAGILKVVSSQETKTAPAISSGTLTLDCNTANCFAVSLNANITTMTLSNVPASGTLYSFVLEFTMDGTARTVSWPAAVKWAGSTPPTLTVTSGKKDAFTFYTYDAGTTWIGAVVGQNF